jgi:hypothetical protein
MDRHTTRLFAIVALVISACAHGSSLDRVQQQAPVAVNKQLWPATAPPLDRGAALDPETNPYLDSIFGEISTPAPVARGAAVVNSTTFAGGARLPIEVPTPGDCQPDNDSPFGPTARQYLDVANRWTAQIRSRFTGQWQWIADMYEADVRCGAWVIKRWVNDQVYSCEPACAFRTQDPLEWLCKNGFNSPIYWEAYDAFAQFPSATVNYTSVDILYGHGIYRVPLNDPAWFDRMGLPQPFISLSNGADAAAVKKALTITFRGRCERAEPAQIVGWNVTGPGRIQPGPKP